MSARFSTTSGPVIRSCISSLRGEAGRGIAAQARSPPRYEAGCWSITRGFQQKFGTSRAGRCEGPDRRADHISGSGRAMSVLRDYHVLNDPIGGAQAARRPRTCARHHHWARHHARGDQDPAGAGKRRVMMVDWNLPNRAEMNRVLAERLAHLPAGVDPGHRQRAGRTRADRRCGAWPYQD